MVKGLKDLLQEARKEAFPPQLIASLQRQALKSNGVLHLSCHPEKSFSSFIEALKLKFDPKVIFLLCLTSGFLLLPKPVRSFIMRKLL